MKPLNWGLVGGGEGSLIGRTHRMCAALDGSFAFKAAALDIDPARAREYGQRLGLDESRAYGSWQEMLDKEKNHPDKLQLVSIATPPVSHHEITCAFLEHGFHVLCEKPMTMTVAEAEDIVRRAEARGLICAVNFSYSGFPLVRHMRVMVHSGQLGTIRSFVAEFSHGFHADARALENPRVRWRYDPTQAGPSSQLADCGSHALHMASFVLGQQTATLSADFAACVPAHAPLEDDALLALRMSGGAVGRLWTSSIALGRMHGLTLQVFGEKGGLQWAQEAPNQLRWQPLGESLRLLERAEPALSPQALRAERLSIGHTEGVVAAFANIYVDLAENILARQEGRRPDPLAGDYPTAVDGLWSMAAIQAAVDSAKNQGRWMDARPPMFQT